MSASATQGGHKYFVIRGTPTPGSIQASDGVYHHMLLHLIYLLLRKKLQSVPNFVKMFHGNHTC